MISQLVGSGTSSALCGSSAIACWLKDGVMLFLEIGLLAWLTFAALSTTLLFPLRRENQARLIRGR